MFPEISPVLVHKDGGRTLHYNVACLAILTILFTPQCRERIEPHITRAEPKLCSGCPIGLNFDIPHPQRLCSMVSGSVS